MTTKTKPTYGAKHEGCWVDNCRGIYMGNRIILEAIAHGFVAEDMQDNTGKLKGDWTDHEHYHELTDDAEEFMQQFAEEGYWFGFSEQGDWGLWASEEEE